MRRLTLAFVASSILFTAVPAGAQASSAEAWRADYDARLRAEYGWLSVSGLSFLQPGVNTVGSLAGSDVVLPPGQAPLEVGRIVYRDGEALLHLRAGVTATVNGEPAPAVVALAPKAGKPAPRVRIDDIEFHWHRSGERVGIRVRDPHSELRRTFTGTRWFAPEPRYDVVGRLERYPEPRAVPVRNVLGDADDYTSPGRLHFTIDGHDVTLVPFAASQGRLWLIFRDATAGRETYGTRFLYAEPLGDDRYRLDFNRTYNPPCAYNPHTTCPTPVRENVLDVAIPAGEKLYEPAVNLTARR